MPPDQDRHRDKKIKVVDEIGSRSPYSGIPSASRPSARPEHRPVQHDPFTTSSHSNNIHPFAEHDHGIKRRFDHDTVDYSTSKGKAVALPLRNGNDKYLENIDQDAEMEDAISPRVDHEHLEIRMRGDHHDGGEDVDIDYLEPQGKGKALAARRQLRIETPNVAAGRRNRETQDEDMESSSDEEISREDRDEELDGRSDDYDGSDTFALDGSPGRSARFPWAEPVDLPVQEFRLRKDGTWDIGPGGD